MFAEFDLDHRLVTQSFFSDLGYSVTEGHQYLKAFGPRGSLRADFDARGRLKGLDVSESTAVAE